jgi:hypothetical protein
MQKTAEMNQPIVGGTVSRNSTRSNQLRTWFNGSHRRNDLTTLGISIQEVQAKGA